jgi:hypothetical protein
MTFARGVRLNLLSRISAEDCSRSGKREHIVDDYDSVLSSGRLCVAKNIFRER